MERDSGRKRGNWWIREGIDRGQGGASPVHMAMQGAVFFAVLVVVHGEGVRGVGLLEEGALILNPLAPPSSSPSWWSSTGKASGVSGLAAPSLLWRFSAGATAAVVFSAACAVGA